MIFAKKEKGSDGNMWIVKETKSITKRWNMLKINKKNTYSYFYGHERDESLKKYKNKVKQHKRIK
jgi:hypothetical protein